MRIILFVMCITFAISTISRAQQEQGRTVLSLDSRFGYSTNSYLNPFLSEWNTSQESAYNFTSILGQQFWYTNGHSVSVTGGFIYEPFLNTQFDNWVGGLALIDYNYRLSGNFSLGLDGGASYLKSSYSRRLLWAQPKLTWFMSPFTLLRLKMGSNFRTYRNYQGISSTSDRFDLYSLEFETWPDYQWRLSAGLHGTLDHIPNIQEGFNTKASVGYYFRTGASVTLSGTMQQYQFDQTTSSGDGGGTPPVGGGGQPTTSTVTNTDRIFRLRLDGAVPLNEQFTLFAGVEALQFNSESANSSTNDYKVSGGMRFSFEPRLGSQDQAIMPEWEQAPEQQKVYIQYSGEGRLFLVGSFSNWNKAGIPLTEQSDNTYVTRLSLDVGTYEYKVLKVEGDSEEWLPFSSEIYTVDDGFGSENAILLVK